MESFEHLCQLVIPSEESNSMDNKSVSMKLDPDYDSPLSIWIAFYKFILLFADHNVY